MGDNSSVLMARSIKVPSHLVLIAYRPHLARGPHNRPAHLAGCKPGIGTSPRMQTNPHARPCAQDRKDSADIQDRIRRAATERHRPSLARAASIRWLMGDDQFETYFVNLS